MVKSGIDADLMVIQKALAAIEFAIQCNDQPLARSVIDALVKRPNSNMANDVGRAIGKYAEHFGK